MRYQQSKHIPLVWSWPPPIMSTFSTANLRPLAPRKSAWAACCVSLLLLAGFFGAIDLVTGTIQEQAAVEKLGQSLSKPGSEEVEQILSEIQEARSKQTLFGLLQESEETLTQRTAITAAALQLRAALLTEDGNLLSPAAQRIEQDFLAVSRFSIPDAEALINTQRLIREHLTAHSRARMQFQEQSADRTHTSEEISALSSRFRLLHGDLNELFSLNTKLRPRTPDFSFYQNGALADLPVIYDLPDHLPDFIALREQLTAIGGRVRLEGDNANELFLQTIEQIRAQSAAVRQAFTALDARRIELDTSIKAISEERGQRRERLLATLAGLIILINS